MIQASELRLGNWLKWYDGMTNEWRLVEVTTIWRNGFYAAGEIHPPDDSTYEPVPLTPEILEMCGFKKSVYAPYSDQEAFVIGEEAKRIIWSAGYFFKPLPGGFVGITQKQYFTLHEFQNAYYVLTDTELTINFPSHYKITGQINLPTTDEYFKNEKE